MRVALEVSVVLVQGVRCHHCLATDLVKHQLVKQFVFLGVLEGEKERDGDDAV